MPPNPPNSLEETLLLEEIYGKAVDSVTTNPNLSSWAKYIGLNKTKTRNEIEQLLGGEAAYNAVVGAKEKSVTPEVRQRIVSHMLQTNSGINQLLKNAVKSPKDEVIVMASGPNRKLTDLISDPDSEDARLLVWCYNNVASAAEKSRLFNYIQNRVEADQLIALMKARKTYDALLADDTNFNIGDPASPAVDSQFDKINKEIAKAEAAQLKAEGERAAALTAKADANVSNYDAKIERAETAIKDAQQKKKDLEKKHAELTNVLTQFSTDLNKFSSAPLADPAALASKLSKKELDDEIQKTAKKPKLADAIADVEKYFSDEDVRMRTDQLFDRVSRNGLGKPAASDIVSGLMMRQYKKDLPDQAQREQFIERVKDVHRRSSLQSVPSATTSASAAAPASGATSAATVPAVSAAPANAPQSKWQKAWNTATWPFRKAWNAGTWSVRKARNAGAWGADKAWRFLNPVQNAKDAWRIGTWPVRKIAGPLWNSNFNKRMSKVGSSFLGFYTRKPD